MPNPNVRWSPTSTLLERDETTVAVPNQVFLDKVAQSRR